MNALDETHGFRSRLLFRLLRYTGHEMLILKVFICRSNKYNNVKTQRRFLIKFQKRISHHLLNIQPLKQFTIHQ